MKERVEKSLIRYRGMLSRKEILIKPLVDKKNSIEVALGDELWTIKNQEEYIKLYYEISMLKSCIEDLEYIISE